MTKAEQRAINTEVAKAWNTFASDCGTYQRTERLRTCSATVTTTDKYYILQSYNTVIAIIDRATDTLYDALRMVYGYTATSAKHIAKFRQDYGKGMWGCARELRYYGI